MDTCASDYGSALLQDDFSVLSSGLVTQESTIGNSNNDLWKYVQPEGQVSCALRWSGFNCSVTAISHCVCSFEFVGCFFIT